MYVTRGTTVYIITHTHKHTHPSAFTWVFGVTIFSQSAGSPFSGCLTTKKEMPSSGFFCYETLNKGEIFPLSISSWELHRKDAWPGLLFSPACGRRLNEWCGMEFAVYFGSQTVFLKWCDNVLNWLTGTKWLRLEKRPVWAAVFSFVPLKCFSACRGCSWIRLNCLFAEVLPWKERRAGGKALRSNPIIWAHRASFQAAWMGNLRAWSQMWPPHISLTGPCNFPKAYWWV